MLDSVAVTTSTGGESLMSTQLLRVCLTLVSPLPPCSQWTEREVTVEAG